MHTHKIRAHKVHSHEVHSHEVHAYEIHLKGTITGCSKNGRLRAHNRFVDPELVSLTHKFQVAILLGAHELG